MVLESLMNPFKAERRPWNMFFFGFIYSTVALFLGIWVFEDYASLVMVFLTVLACAPLMYATIKLEEKKDLEIEKENQLLKEHGKALSFFMFMFLGIALSYTFWYILLPTTTSASVFSIQTETINTINNQVTGNSQSLSIFTKIFLNNIKVLIFCILFAFIYGLGAIFILVWNASVIGTAMGNFIKGKLSALASSTGLTTVSHYFQATSMGFLRYVIHGIPEILAYFIGGLAGGIISIAVIRHDFGTEKFERIILDSSNLIILAVIVLLLASFLEVFVTPLFF